MGKKKLPISKKELSIPFSDLGRRKWDLCISLEEICIYMSLCPNEKEKYINGREKQVILVSI